jgi:hypothetical protein
MIVQIQAYGVHLRKAFGRRNYGLNANIHCLQITYSNIVRKEREDLSNVTNFGVLEYRVVQLW